MRGLCQILGGTDPLVALNFSKQELRGNQVVLECGLRVLLETMLEVSQGS